MDGSRCRINRTCSKLFALVGLTEKPVIREQPKKSAPKAKAQERMREAAEKAEAARAAAEQAAE